HLSLVNAGPDERRKFIDSAICQFKPKYIIMLAKYKKIIIQKNALIKHYNRTKQIVDNSLFEVYNKQIASLAIKIYDERKKYIENLSKKAKELYSGISSKKETLDINYIINYETDENLLFNQLCEKQNTEIKAGFSIIGPHRDDVEILTCNKSAKNFGSQGQIRSCVLVLKLAEGEILKEIIGENPIILLDDVLSELDKKRQDFLLNNIKGRQIFITCCDDSNFQNVEIGKQFRIKGGRIIMESFSN
ncbi:MAG: DNA replication and repair protein RecF, partial [Oscillospiraceae bacterium]